MAGSARNVAEAVLPDACAGVNDHAVADQGMHDRAARADDAVAADAHVRADHRGGSDHGAGPDLRTRTDDRRRVDHDAGFEPRGRMHQRARRDAARLEQRGRPHRARIELLRDRHEGAVWRGRHQNRDVARRSGGEFLGRQADAGVRCGECGAILHVLHEREFAWRRAVERRDPADAPFADVAARNRTCQRGNLLRCQSLRALEELKLGHATLAVAGVD